LNIKNLLLVVLSLFLLSGCLKKEIYTKIYDKSEIGLNLKSVSLSGDNFFLLDKVEKSLKKRGLSIKEDSLYKIKLISHYVVSCSNPIVKSTGSDFDGFIRLSLLKNSTEIYRCQQDFKVKVTQDMVDRLVGLIFSDMKIK
jgi:hypothetical protein